MKSVSRRRSIGKNILHFTKTAVSALPPAPEGKFNYYMDQKQPGLQLIVTPTGVKTFYLYRRVQKKPYRYRLGRFPDITPELARTKAQIAGGKIALGGDLRAEKKTSALERLTLADAFKEFQAARSTLKPQTLYYYGKYLDRAFADWKLKPLVNLTKDHIGKRHERLTKESGPGYADGAMRFLRSLLNFARNRYEKPDGTPILADNPVRRLSQTRAWHRQKRRQTYIRSDQLAPWFAAVTKLKSDPDDSEAGTVSDWLQLMMLTGLRRSEALTLKWVDVDLVNGTLTVRDTKNSEDHTLPLSDYLLEILSARRAAADLVEEPSAYVFASYGRHGHLVDPRKLMEKVTAASSVTFSPHDLRRTFTTVAESLDISAYAVKRLINHKMRQDVTAGYIVTDVERLRTPMQSITQYMLVRAGLRAPVSAERRDSGSQP
jgi:integrase